MDPIELSQSRYLRSFLSDPSTQEDPDAAVRAFAQRFAALYPGTPRSELLQLLHDANASLGSRVGADLIQALAEHHGGPERSPGAALDHALRKQNKKRKERRIALRAPK